MLGVGSAASKRMCNSLKVALLLFISKCTTSDKLLESFYIHKLNDGNPPPQKKPPRGVKMQSVSPLSVLPRQVLIGEEMHRQFVQNACGHFKKNMAKHVSRQQFNTMRLTLSKRDICEVIVRSLPMVEKSVAIICNKTGDRDAICRKKGTAQTNSSAETGLLMLSWKGAKKSRKITCMLR